MTSKIFGVTRSLYITLGEQSINTMINAMKRTWKSLKAKFWTVIDAISPRSSQLPDLHVILAAAEGNVMNTGKRYRKTSGHSPFYSLFTFFGLRS